MLKLIKLRRLSSEGIGCPPIKRAKTNIPKVHVVVEQLSAQEIVFDAQMPATSSIAELKARVEEALGISSAQLFNAEEPHGNDQLNDADRLCNLAAMDDHDEQRTYRFFLEPGDHNNCYCELDTTSGSANSDFRDVAINTILEACKGLIGADCSSHMGCPTSIAGKRLVQTNIFREDLLHKPMTALQLMRSVRIGRTNACSTTTLALSAC
jgi:hypothetical protein